MERPPIIFSPRDLRDLRTAKELLESPSFTMRLSNLLGTPVEAAMGLLPKPALDKINKVANAALFRALGVAVATTSRQSKAPSNRMHKALVGASGGIGGIFGLGALAIELPISTTIMLRSVAEIARSEGHDPKALETKLDCLAVFAFNGSRGGANSTDSAYWVTRVALRQSLADATSHLAGKTAIDKSAPAVARLVGAIGARYGVLISEETAAKAMPILGAVGGSVVNMIFMDHFQHMARGHFIIRRLEKKYGAEEAKRQYAAIIV